MTYEKSLLILITFLALFSPVQSETVTENENDIQLRDDLIFVMLYPSIQQELEKQYGEITQNECGKIIKIEKLPIGTYLFNVTVQVRTFEDAHGPPNDLVTITFSNEKTTEWHAIDFKRKRLKSIEIRYFITKKRWVQFSLYPIFSAVLSIISVTILSF
ncbi:DUF3888 domain-containing protein [Sporosarcina limicola]|uniref:DUF3888 domain-containing protein n=1 Tax=Sporosarcina limicola TaxID=34101 RepID=A0A927MNV3_9BACL|nr:DUF3888 domain-containing protein [Sporosarcina limicola]MBE1556552.1 hypothetical protein [Sporosarcina limicola]